MAISVFDLFSIGIGPSSSHTVGPMRAANLFIEKLQQLNMLGKTIEVTVELYGSLGATGKGHGSDKAILLGLENETPEQVDTDQIDTRLEKIKSTGQMNLGGTHPIKFDLAQHLIFHRDRCLSYHSNGMTFSAKNSQGEEHVQACYYSIGGGFVIDEKATDISEIVPDNSKLPHPFTTGEQLLQMCNLHNKSISQLMLENELIWNSQAEIEKGLLDIWKVMQACVKNGCKNTGILPGGMKVKRRAPALFDQLNGNPYQSIDPLMTMDWVNLYAIAVNEENAAGGRVVTAPTNGAAGILPAVMHYYSEFCPIADEQGIIRFLLTAAAIGILYKTNASISGAEVGCQGEVGSACSMAAGALTEVMGGSPEQVENAAEIGMEHNLGLTCDPIGGLVQVPCIERNAMAAIKAINASRIALRGDGVHFVSLDKVIKTMRDTGADMHTKYKETARGGLAVNVIEC